MARQYIEPMLATRRSNAWADPAAALALRLPGLCAVCHGWGRGRVCSDCRTAFAAAWDRLVTAFKFHGALELTPLFARALADAAERRAGARPELLLPVRLAPARLRERGYNQAWELARRIARRSDVRAGAQWLLRIRETAHRLVWLPTARAGNVRGAFAVEPSRRAEIAGRHIAVVDDVMTTGSTATELAQVLKQAGAATVEIWVVARTPRPGE